jgi:plastocyanin
MITSIITTKGRIFPSGILTDNYFSNTLTLPGSNMVQILRSIAVFCWLAFASEASSYGESATTTSLPSSTTSSAAVQTIDVGESGLTFDPDTLTVSPGGKVEFHFYPGNHSVVQTSFANPCRPLSETSFFSGFVPDKSTIFTLMINDTNPIWYYCGQVGHCQAGMVGVINPPYVSH